jgi:hypothetical protein
MGQFLQALDEVRKKSIHFFCHSSNRITNSFSDSFVIPFAKK